LIFSAERTPANDAAERPIRERQMAAYHRALKYIEGRHVLEIGCGEGIGTSILASKAHSIVALDYSEKALQVARTKFSSKNIEFVQTKVPPIGFDDMSFDAVVCFQMIEHLERPEELVDEIRRVLRNDAHALIATVNKEETISDNPYHLHEFVAEEFRELLKNSFNSVELYGVFGDELFMRYWQNNRKWVNTFMRIDMLNLSRLLPRGLKQGLFSAASRLMRTSLRRGEPDLCNNIKHENFLFLQDNLSKCLDFFGICRKTSS
jgi:2-polyprenyl-3-methyl-5-hydroxy-6-metoxy-1,4-benzoquinol methylase